jgi:ankyrin repeat protein
MITRSLKAILRGAAHPNTPGAEGRTPLHRAAREGKIDDLKILLENGGDVHLSDAAGEQPLQMAARKGQLDCVRLLIQAGADVNYIPPQDISEYSESALCSATRKSRYAEALAIVKELLHAGADPNAASSAKRYPLHSAARAGNVDMVRAILTAGAKVNTSDGHGRLPLHSALNGEPGNPEVVTLLIQAGADINASDNDGTPPVFYTINSSEQSPSLLKALLAARPNLSLTDRQWKKKPLALARLHDLNEIASLLKQPGETETPPSSDGPITTGVAIEGDDLLPENLDDDEYDKAEFEAAEIGLQDGTFVKEAAHMAVLWPLQSAHGWQASRIHWELLSAAAEPLPLTRLAYFARGRFNKPAGKELEDGSEVFGESYLSAIERFINLGYLQLAPPAETLGIGATLQQLKEVAAVEGIKPGGANKSAIITAILSKRAGEDLVARLGVSNHYQLTPSGKELVARKDQQLQSIRQELAAQLRDQVVQVDFQAVWKTLLLLDPLVQFAPATLPRVATGKSCCASGVRRVMDAAIPAKLGLNANEAALWKTWAVLIEFLTVSSRQWPLKPWLDIPAQVRDKDMLPKDLVRTLCGKNDNDLDDSTTE